MPPDMQWMVNRARGRRRHAPPTPPSAPAAPASAAQVYAREGDPADAILDVAEELRRRPDRRRQQGHDRRQALPARLRAQQGLPPRALRGDDHPDDRRRAARSRRRRRSARRRRGCRARARRGRAPSPSAAPRPRPASASAPARRRRSPARRCRRRAARPSRSRCSCLGSPNWPVLRLNVICTMSRPDSVERTAVRIGRRAARPGPPPGATRSSVGPCWSTRRGSRARSSRRPTARRTRAPGRRRAGARLARPVAGRADDQRRPCARA